jgi:hypothetical protein
MNPKPSSLNSKPYTRTPKETREVPTEAAEEEGAGGVGRLETLAVAVAAPAPVVDLPQSNPTLLTLNPKP